MDSKTLSEIDFYRIRDEVAAFCMSEEGKDDFLQRQPLTKYAEIEQLKNTSREWMIYLSASTKNGISGWGTVKPLFAVIRTKGASLTLENVHSLGQFIKSINNFKKCTEIHKVKLSLKYLPSQADLLPDLSDAEKKIFRVISPDGQLRDLPEIVAIRKQMANLNSKIKTIMQGFTSDQKLSGILESTVPVLRNGRQVLAVKASQQNRIPGIIHEVSQTAQTVYIEPEEAVLCSNELIQKEFELAAAIKKILLELTQSLEPSIPDFKKALPVMIFLDQTLAAARWGAQNNCIFIETAQNEAPLLLGARHPLLKEKAVPIDIRFMEQKRVLIITGPNTGGKTVSLKTFALFSVMNQAGLPVPASEGSRLPVFTDVFADIGDDQSLDQNLSTFSGHMKNIAEAVQKAGPKTLVLLDELGSGTDPQEGTAIAMSVLDDLIKKKAFVLVTTHMGVLKNYGYTNEFCVNASVEFNQDTLSPSYRLLMGIPGESHALDIAEKNGLPQNICKAARNYIATEQADVSALIRGLNRKHVELNKIQKEAEQKEKDYKDKFERLKVKELELRRKENDLKKGKQQELNDFLIHSRRQLENLVRTLKEGEITREKTLGVKKFISELEERTEYLEKKTEAEDEKLIREKEEFEKTLKKHPASNKKTKKKMSNAEALASATTNEEFYKFQKARGEAEEEELVFEEGAWVISASTQTKGVLVKEEKKGLWLVQFGSLKMSVKQKDLVLIKPEKEYKPSISIDLVNREEDGVVDKKSQTPVFELRLLGMHVDEAIRTLEKQIDLCLLNNFTSFSVIHGKGDGILQQAVQDYLSHVPAVKDFSFAPPEDGGTGKTYVKLN
jgi:DNA mismatch repair protein MutS2